MKERFKKSEMKYLIRSFKQWLELLEQLPKGFKAYRYMDNECYMTNKKYSIDIVEFDDNYMVHWEDKAFSVSAEEVVLKVNEIFNEIDENTINKEVSSMFKDAFVEDEELIKNLEEKRKKWKIYRKDFV